MPIQNPNNSIRQRQERLHARISDWVDETEHSHQLDMPEIAEDTLTVTELLSQERYHSGNVEGVSKVGSLYILDMPDQKDGLDSDNTTSASSIFSNRDFYDSRSVSPRTPLSPQFDRWCTEIDVVQAPLSSLANALDLAVCDSIISTELADIDWLESTLPLSFAKAINAELLPCNLNTWADHFDAYGPYQPGPESVSRSSVETPRVIPQTQVVNPLQHKDSLKFITDHSQHQSFFQGQEYTKGKDCIEEQHLVKKQNSPKKQDYSSQDNSNKTQGLKIVVENHAVKLNGWASPNLRQHVPSEMWKLVDEISLIFDPQCCNTKARSHAHGVIDYFYMSHASQQARASGDYQQPRLQNANRFSDWLYRAENGCGAAPDSSQKSLDNSTILNSNTEDERPFHHLNFSNDKVYHKSATPPEVSMWAAFTSRLPPKLCCQGPTRERVLASQAGKLVDPFNYSGPENLLELQGTKLRDAVTGYVQVVYETDGEWENDRYENDETFPRSTYELSCYNSDCGLGMVPIYKVTTEHDGDIHVNDDGRSHPVHKNPRSTFEYFPSKLSVVQNIYDENPEENVKDTPSSTIELPPADIDDYNIARPSKSMLLCMQSEKSTEFKHSESYQNAFQGSQEDNAQVYQDYTTLAKYPQPVTAANTSAFKEVTIDKSIYYSPNDLCEPEVTYIVSQPDEEFLNILNNQTVDESNAEEETSLPQDNIGNGVENNKVDRDGVEVAAADAVVSIALDFNRLETTGPVLSTMVDVGSKSLWELSESPERLRRIGKAIIEGQGIPDEVLDRITLIPYIEGWSENDYMANYELYWKYISYEKVGRDIEVDEDSVVESPTQAVTNDVSLNKLESWQEHDGLYLDHGCERPLANTSIQAFGKPFAIFQAEDQAVFSDASANKEHHHIHPFHVLSPIIEAPEVDQELLADTLYEPNSVCTLNSSLHKTSRVSRSSKRLAPLLGQVLSPIQEILDVEEEVVSAPPEETTTIHKDFCNIFCPPMIFAVNKDAPPTTILSTQGAIPKKPSRLNGSVIAVTRQSNGNDALSGVGIQAKAEIPSQKESPPLAPQTSAGSTEFTCREHNEADVFKLVKQVSEEAHLEAPNAVADGSCTVLITDKGGSLDMLEEKSLDSPPDLGMIPSTRPSKRRGLIAQSRILSHLKEVDGNFLKTTKTQPRVQDIQHEVRAGEQTNGKGIMRHEPRKELCLHSLAFNLTKSVLETSFTQEDELPSQRNYITEISRNISQCCGIFETITTSVGDKILHLKNSWSLPRNIAW
ncbi:hypothetical protein MMC06_006790 [Schaereria dolodes]|nr:hypothetical protein [Schaereria dolodes]